MAHPRRNLYSALFALSLLGVSLAGEPYVHAPIFGDASVFESFGSNGGSLGFSNVEPVVIETSAARNPSVLNVSVVTQTRKIRVSWANVQKPSKDDLIVLSCADQPWSLNEGFDAVKISFFAGTFGDHGSIDLPNRTVLPDLRCQYVFRYVRHEGEFGSVVAEGELRQDFGIRPTQVHLAFTGVRTEMLVTWVTGDAKNVPQVKWGTVSGSYTHTVSGKSSTYSADMMCNAPANTTGPTKFIHPGYFHRVVLTDLPFDSTIYYTVGNSASGWKKESSFRSRLPAHKSAVKFIMYADQALPVPFAGKAWRMTNQVVRDINAGYNGFLLHPGDLGYAEGSGAIWDVWGGLIEPITSRIPYEVTVGNHEYDHVGLKLDPSGAKPGGWHPQEGKNPEPWGNMGDDSRGECAVPIVARFNGTGNGNGLFWYSFEEGGIHVVVLSSEHDWRVGSRQYNWLEADLQSVDRKVTPWIVLATHRMMYTSQLKEEADYLVSLAFRKNVEPLLNKYKVNLMLVGHQHSYERSCAVRNGTCVADGSSGTTHLCVGSAGANKEKGGFSPKFGNFSVKHLDDYGYIRVDANSTRMYVEFIRTNKHDNVSAGQVWDTVSILPWA